MRLAFPFIIKYCQINTRLIQIAWLELDYDYNNL